MRDLLICTVVLGLSLNMVFPAKGTAGVKESSPSVVENKIEESTWSHFKMGMNSSLLSLLYTTVKVNIALAGGIVGGVAYPFSGFNADVSKKIWDKTMGGTYLITEDILRGDEDAELFFKKGKDQDKE